jgi:hypothetical protein
MAEGTVVAIYCAEKASTPLRVVEEAHAVPGRGLDGDRYFAQAGTFSSKPGTGRDVTLIESEQRVAMARALADTRSRP